MTAIELNKPIQLMHESDPRHGEWALHRIVISIIPYPVFFIVSVQHQTDLAVSGLHPCCVIIIAENGVLAGAFDFAETNDAPPEVASLTLTHESLPWRRRKFEQDAILAELIKISGLSVGRRKVPASVLWDINAYY